MTAAIFLVSTLAIWSAAGGRRELAITFFGIALVASIFWLDHLAAAPLKLAF